MSHLNLIILLGILFCCYILFPSKSNAGNNAEPLNSSISIDTLIQWNDKALALKTKGYLSKSKDIYPKVLIGIAELLGEDSQAYFDVSVNYTRLLNELGDTDNSKLIYTKLDSILVNSTIDIEAESLLLYKYSLAEANLYIGNYSDALAYYKEIERRYQSDENSKDIVYINTLSSIAECFELSEDYRLSIDYFERAIEESKNIQSANQKINLRNNYLEMAIKADSLELGKSIWESINPNLHDSLNNVIEYVAYFNYIKLNEYSRNQIDKTYITKGLAVYEAMLNDILADLNERQLVSFAKRKFKNFMQVLRVLQHETDPDIISQLYRCQRKSKDIVNRYYLNNYHDSKTYGSTTNDSAVYIILDFFEIDTQDSITQFGYFKENKEGISLTMIDFQIHSSDPLKLVQFQPFWDEIAKELNEEELVLISPVGKLHRFNFQTYDTQNNVTFLIARKISSLKSIPNDSLSILAIGGLYYNQDHHNSYSKQIVKRVNSYDYLPFSQKELDYLKQRANEDEYSFTSFSRSTCSESALQNEITKDSNQILHFSTHGFYQNEQGRIGAYNSGFYNSGLLLSYPDTMSVDSKTDNILYGSDLLDFKLKNTALVYMSSCQSGVSDVVYGDNLYGIQEAFRRTGVRNIISTSDVVYDDISYAFAKQFYDSLFNGETIYQSYKIALHSIYNNYGLVEACKFKFTGDGQLRYIGKTVNHILVSILLILFSISVYLFINYRLSNA